MSIPLGVDTVTRIRPAGTDWQGDPAGSATETDVTGCMVEPAGSQGGQASSREANSSGGDTVITTAQLFAPAGTDILATDRVRWRGDVYAVDGKPDKWHDDTGAEDHVLARLRLLEGT